MIRADYVAVDAARGMVFVVYPPGVTLGTVKGVATVLGAGTRLKVYAEMRRLGSRHEQAVVGLDLGSSPTTANTVLQRLKELTYPRLPIGIGTMTVNLLLCKCNYVSTRPSDILYVRGFGPSDGIGAFEKKFGTALSRMPVAQLLDAGPRPPHTPLMNALVAALAQLGAYATEIIIRPIPDTRPCTHPK